MQKVRKSQSCKNSGIGRERGEHFRRKEQQVQCPEGRKIFSLLEKQCDCD